MNKCIDDVPNNKIRGVYIYIYNFLKRQPSFLIYLKQYLDIIISEKKSKI